MRIIRIIISIIILISVLIGLVILNFADIKAFSKKYFASRITNKTNHNIHIAETYNIKKLKPNQSSKDINIYDADYLIIENPTEYDGVIRHDGIIKLCDYSSVKVITDKEIDKLELTSGTIVCKLINDFGWYESMEIFKQKDKQTGI